MNTNFEVLNFLNLNNPRLGKLYKVSGYSPLPKGFSLDNEKIKECLYLGQMKKWIKYPEFIYDTKNHVKKYFKNSIKNIKKIEKNINKFNFSPEFSEKFKIYLDMRLEITTIILQEFNNQRFDESLAYQEIYDLNPIFGNFLEGLFLDDCNLSEILADLEDKYQISYEEKIQLLEKEKTKKKNQNVQKVHIPAQNLKTKEEKPLEKSAAKHQAKTAIIKIAPKTEKHKIDTTIKEK